MTRQSVKGSPGFWYRDTKTKGRVYGFHWNGKPVKGGPTLKDAKAKRRELETRRYQGEHVVVSSIKWNDVAEQWFASLPAKTRPRTKKAYRGRLDNHILPFFASWKLQDVDEFTIASFVRHQEEANVAPSSQAQDVTIINQVFKFARRKRWSTNPVALLTKQERPREADKVDRVLSEAEILAIHDAIDPRYQLPIKFLAMTGLRIGEALALRWSDIDFEHNVVHVRHSLNEKGELDTPKYNSVRKVWLDARLADALKQRRDHLNTAPLDAPPVWVTVPEAARQTGIRADLISWWTGHRGQQQAKQPRVPLSSRLVDAATSPEVAHKSGIQRRILVNLNEVQTYRDRRNSLNTDEDFVFYGCNGQRVTVDAFQNVFRRACAKAGLDEKRSHNRHEVTPHTFRHSYGSMLISRGMNIVAVSKQLGHKNIETTLKTYTHEYEQQQHEQALRATLGGFGQVLVSPASQQALSVAIPPAA